MYMMKNESIILIVIKFIVCISYVFKSTTFSLFSFVMRKIYKYREIMMIV